MKNLIFSILIAMFLALPSMGMTVDLVEENFEGESCTTVRQYRKQTCDKAAQVCIQVHELDAFNKIRPCAHYAQECSQAGDKESLVCNPSSDSRVTSLPMGQSHKKTRSKPL